MGNSHSLSISSKQTPTVQDDALHIAQLLSCSEGGLGSDYFDTLDLKGICKRAERILLTEPSLLFISTDIVIVGDLHGMLGGLQQIFSRLGAPPARRYLFLGDYVDRGIYGLEVFSLLLLLKLVYPEHVFLLRGNHECETLNLSYGFAMECIRKTSRKTWGRLLRVFDALPLAAVVQGRAFCVHGGLSPDLYSLEQIARIRRPSEVPLKGIMHDLLWTDPAPRAKEHLLWSDSARGPAHFYGRAVVESFLLQNNLEFIVRSHSFIPSGYEWRFEHQLVTIFSSMDYGGPDNSPAVLILNEHQPPQVLLTREPVRETMNSPIVNSMNGEQSITV